MTHSAHSLQPLTNVSFIRSLLFTVDLTNGQLTPNNNTPLLTQALSGEAILGIYVFIYSILIVCFSGIRFLVAFSSFLTSSLITSMPLFALTDRKLLFVGMQTISNTFSSHFNSIYHHITFNCMTYIA